MNDIINGAVNLRFIWEYFSQMGVVGCFFHWLSKNWTEYIISDCLTLEDAQKLMANIIVTNSSTGTKSAFKGDKNENLKDIKSVRQDCASRFHQ